MRSGKISFRHDEKSLVPCWVYKQYVFFGKIVSPKPKIEEKKKHFHDSCDWNFKKEKK